MAVVLLRLCYILLLGVGFIFILILQHKTIGLARFQKLLYVLHYLYYSLVIFFQFCPVFFQSRASMS